jgi:hypothetical protein
MRIGLIFLNVFFPALRLTFVYVFAFEIHDGYFTVSLSIEFLLRAILECEVFCACGNLKSRNVVNEYRINLSQCLLQNTKICVC